MIAVFDTPEGLQRGFGPSLTTETVHPFLVVGKHRIPIPLDKMVVHLMYIVHSQGSELIKSAL